MSGFNENPFAEPAVYNPFADPSVQQAAGSNVAKAQQGLEEYNPFDESQKAKSNAVRGATNPPPTIQAAPVISPTPAQSQPPQINTADFQKRQEELERKDQELRRREEELKNAPMNARRNNWPPLPEKFCVQPCFYQDINVEIPLEFQKIVRMLYYIWMFHSLLYILNVFGCLALFIQENSGSMFGLSILYCILFTPASYVCWFRPVYKAFRSDSSFNFMVFFVIFFAQLIASVIQAVGIPDLGTCGFIVALTALAKSTIGDKVVGGLTLLIGMGFGAAAFADFLLIVRVSRLYRSTGASLSKARDELRAGVTSNERFQQMRDDVLRETIRSTVQSATNPSSNRF